MSNTDKILSVRLHGKPVGILEQDAHGKMVFQYDESAEMPLSMSMPIRQDPYDSLVCEAYFGGLLPESPAARKKIGQQLGINHNNSFYLLRAIGHDCAGAVTIQAVNSPVQEVDFQPLKGRIMSAKELAGYILELPRKPLFIGIEGMRLSLAGAQDKTAICLLENEPALPLEGSPTTHILKPAIQTIEGSIQNEYLCLKTAGKLGLNVPVVEIRQAMEVPYLLVKRYDREISSQQMVKRIHQEDFCQALGIITANKYQADGGPSLVDCLTLLRRNTRPALDRNALMERIVFNFLLGNTDAHGKNFSLLHLNVDQNQLAPAYDLLCTQVYPEITAKMAMKIGGHYPITNILPRHWEKLCEQAGFSFPALKKTMLRQCEQIPRIVETEIQHLKELGQNHMITEAIQRYVTKHCQRIQKQFATN